MAFLVPDPQYPKVQKAQIQNPKILSLALWEVGLLLPSLLCPDLGAIRTESWENALDGYLPLAFHPPPSPPTCVCVVAGINLSGEVGGKLIKKRTGKQIKTTCGAWLAMLRCGAI